MEGKLFVLFALLSAVYCVAVDNSIIAQEHETIGHTIAKRFINPSLPVGDFADASFSHIRTKRSPQDEEDCERLGLCKLHARSQRNFLAAFQLYFVNKENARLWDHQAHSVSDCYRLYSCYR